jgi:hypothetical protein
MDGDRRQVVPPAGLWLVPGCALLAAVIGSFLAAVVAISVVPSGTVGGVPGNVNSGLPVAFLAFFFGIPLAALLGALVAYAGVVLRRPAPFGVAAVGVGAVAGPALAYLVPALGSWWLSLPSDTNPTSAILTVVEVVPLAVAITLSAKLPVLEMVATRRGRVACFLAFGALAGVLIGVFVGGVAGGLTALQDSCSRDITCQGPSVTGALSSGSLLGAWFGGVAGLAGGALAWAIPPWSNGAGGRGRSDPPTGSPGSPRS